MVVYATTQILVRVYDKSADIFDIDWIYLKEVELHAFEKEVDSKQNFGCRSFTFRVWNLKTNHHFEFEETGPREIKRGKATFSAVWREILDGFQIKWTKTSGQFVVKKAHFKVFS